MLNTRREQRAVAPEF